MTPAPLKGMNLDQPYASLIAGGVKRWVARPRETDWRGWVAILAVGDPAGRDQVFLRLLAHRMQAYLPTPLPRRVIICVARLVDVLPTALLRPRQPGETTTAVHVLDPLEYGLGDLQASPFGWRFDDVRRLTAPVPCRGWLRLWTVPPEVRASIDAQVGPL